MRLIDADKLKIDISETKELLEKGLGEDAKYAYMTAHSVLNKIDAQPTAYDVDKVVKQLEEKTELAYERYMDCPVNIPCFVRYRTQYEERKMCLEIVKEGGVHE